MLQLAKGAKHRLAAAPNEALSLIYKLDPSASANANATAPLANEKAALRAQICGVRLWRKILNHQTTTCRHRPLNRNCTTDAGRPFLKGAVLDLKFDVEADLSISDLRNVEEWQERLSGAGKLRVQHNGRILGVLVSTTVWQKIEKQTARYERFLRLIDDERDAQIVAERDGHGPLLRGSPARCT